MIGFGSCRNRPYASKKNTPSKNAKGKKNMNTYREQSTAEKDMVDFYKNDSNTGAIDLLLRHGVVSLPENSMFVADHRSRKSFFISYAICFVHGVPSFGINYYYADIPLASTVATVHFYPCTYVEAKSRSKTGSFIFRLVRNPSFYHLSKLTAITPCGSVSISKPLSMRLYGMLVPAIID